MRIRIEAHPLLHADVFVTHFAGPLGQLTSLSEIRRHFTAGAETPFKEDAGLKKDIRDMLRHGGFRPSGRSKPASEYLLKALEKGWFSPEKGINAAVDICNVVSLHSGLPISVLDLELCSPPLRIAICGPQTSYAFNPSGQILDASGLVALHDSLGPCGSPVKDSQRTKTHDGTQRTVTVIWSHAAHSGRAQRARDWYESLLASIEATVEPAEITKDWVEAIG
jgi:DNA/RNA-binding domain of Phe-tRNA-synthetase-like protein